MSFLLMQVGTLYRRQPLDARLVGTPCYLIHERNHTNVSASLDIARVTLLIQDVASQPENENFVSYHATPSCSIMVMKTISCIFWSSGAIGAASWDIRCQMSSSFRIHDHPP